MQMQKISVFDVEEQETINNVTKDELVTTFTRKKLIQQIDFTLAISVHKEVLELYRGLREKVIAMTDDEWNSMRELLPFSLSYSAEDQPQDEAADA